MGDRVLEFDANGETLICSFHCERDDGQAPGVLVMPDIRGIGEHVRERAERLAKRGYAALAMDLHGGGRMIDQAEIDATLGRFFADPQITLNRARASLEALRREPGVDAGRIAAIGFCYGGTLALEMARCGMAVQAVVGFHSQLGSSFAWNPADLTARVLACVGAEDPLITLEDRRSFENEMRKTSADWQLHVYGGVYHSFTDRHVDAAGMPDFARYDAVADTRSWSAMEDLLERTFH